MKRFFLAAIAALLCAAPATAQTIKTLGYNTTNGVIVAGTNALSFTNSVSFATLAFTNITASNITLNGVLSFTNGPTNQLQLTRANLLPAYSGNASRVLALNSNATDVQWVTMTAGTNTNTVSFPILISQGGSGATTASGARNNLSLGAAWLTNTSVSTFRSDIGLSGTWLTNTNVTNFRSAIGLGATFLTNTNAAAFASAIGLGTGNAPTFNGLLVSGLLEISDGNALFVDGELTIDAIFNYYQPFTFLDSSIAAQSRTNLGATTLGSAIFTAANQTTARQALGLQSYTNTLTNSVGTLEIGSTNNSVTVGWTIAPTNATYALRTLVRGTNTNTVTNNQSTLAFTSLGITNDTTWTLTVGDGQGATNTATTSVLFQNYMMWGRATNETLGNNGLALLHTTGGGAERAFSTTRSRSITMDGEGRYIFIAYPQGFGAATFTVGGLPNSAWTVATNSYTNTSGYVTNYLIYRTDTIQNGTGINIVVQ
jgi:hypothetical protein